MNKGKILQANLTAQNIEPKEIKTDDIIIEKVYEEITEDKDGNEVKKRKTKKVNITRLINESAKTIKITAANEMIATLDAMKEKIMKESK